MKYDELVDMSCIGASARALLGEVLPDTFRVGVGSVEFQGLGRLPHGSASDVAARAPEPEGALEKASLDSLDPTASLFFAKLGGSLHIPRFDCQLEFANDEAPIGCEGRSFPLPMGAAKDEKRLVRAAVVIVAVDSCVVGEVIGWRRWDGSSTLSLKSGKQGVEACPQRPWWFSQRRRSFSVTARVVCVRS